MLRQAAGRPWPRAEPDPRESPGFGPAQQVGRRPVAEPNSQASTTSPGRANSRRVEVVSAPSMLTAGNDLVPTMTGWTNSTAT